MPFPNATDDIHSLFRASLGRSFRFLSFSLELFFFSLASREIDRDPRRTGSEQLLIAE